MSKQGHMTERIYLGTFLPMPEIRSLSYKLSTSNYKKCNSSNTLALSKKVPRYNLSDRQSHKSRLFSAHEGGILHARAASMRRMAGIAQVTHARRTIAAPAPTNHAGAPTASAKSDENTSPSGIAQDMMAP